MNSNSGTVLLQAISPTQFHLFSLSSLKFQGVLCYSVRGQTAGHVRNSIICFSYFIGSDY